MKKTVLFVLLGSLLLIPAAGYAEPDQTATKAPPVSQPLVREGDFAVKLVESLKIGTAKSEAEAEAMLVSSGIAPRNGWIADYPVTPDVIAELHKTVSDAADAKRLSMGKEEALKALRTVAVELELPIIAEVPGKYAEGPPSAAPQYSQPSVIDNYYYTEGPPVVTYYPPPWDYAYLYAWVPTPFFFGTFFFPGFFILNDFDIVVFRHFDHFGHHFHRGFHHGHDFGHRITNHFTDPKTHQVMRVDPAMRTRGFNGPATRTAAFSSPAATRGATSIMNRSVETARSRGLTGTTGSSLGRGSAPRAANGRTFNPGNTGSFQSFRGPSTNQGRTFSTLPRTFSRTTQGFERSFSPPSRSFSSPPMTSRSFSGGFQGGGLGGFHGGGFSGGFHGGGFSGGGGLH